MSKTITRLKTDHRRMRNVLTALKTKRDEMTSHLLNGDTDHLFCMIDYLGQYPDKVHHPLEDFVFTQITESALTDEQAESISNLQRQHEQLIEKTNELLTHVDALGTGADMGELKSVLDDYIEMQLAHMSFEEQHIFPMALEVLSKEAWDKLDNLGDEAGDPLFDKLERRYGAIYKYLEVDEAETARGNLTEPLYKYLGASGLAS